MRKILGIILIGILVLGRPDSCRAKEPEPELYARSALLMEADSGRILLQKNAEEFLPVASTTKIMTCILAIENGNLDDYVEVSRYAAGRPKVKLEIREGERYRLEDLLYALMLRSCNDVAVAIAEHISGNCEEFAELMNQKARDIGCTNTFFITPNGLDATDENGRTNGSTAKDLALIAGYAIQNEVFCDIIRTRSYSFSDAEQKRSHSVQNADAFLTMYDGAIGIKTGYTGAAGYCFVGAVRANDRTLVSVVLASGWPPNKSYKWKDTKALMDYGMQNYAPATVKCGEYEKGKRGIIDVRGGVQKQVTIKSCSGDFELYLSDEDELAMERILPEYVDAPIEAGAVIGFDCYYLNGELCQVYPIVVCDTISKPGYSFFIKEVLEKIFL